MRSGDIDRALQTRDARHAEVMGAVGGLYVVSGSVRYSAPGEINLDLIFPLHFTEEPFIDVMSVAGAGSLAMTGGFPRIGSIHVFSWDIKMQEALPHFKGARVGVVVQAPDKVKGKIVWRAMGKSLVGSTVNP